MIEEVKIRNYGCLRDVKVRLEPLTALVFIDRDGDNKRRRKMKSHTRDLVTPPLKIIGIAYEQ